MQTVEQNINNEQEAIQKVELLKKYLQDFENNKYYIALACKDIFEQRYYLSLGYPTLKEFVEYELEAQYDISMRNFHIYVQIATLILKYDISYETFNKYKLSRLREFIRYLNFLTAQNEKITKAKFEKLCSQFQLASITVKELKQKIDALIRPEIDSKTPENIELSNEDISNMQRKPVYQPSSPVVESVAESTEHTKEIIEEEKEEEKEIPEGEQPDSQLVITEETKRGEVIEEKLIHPPAKPQTVFSLPCDLTQKVSLNFSIDKDVYETVVKPVFDFIISMTNYQENESIFLYLCLDYYNVCIKAENIAKSA